MDWLIACVMVLLEKLAGGNQPGRRCPRRVAGGSVSWTRGRAAQATMVAAEVLLGGGWTKLRPALAHGASPPDRSGPHLGAAGRLPNLAEVPGASTVGHLERWGVSWGKRLR